MSWNPLAWFQNLAGGDAKAEKERRAQEIGRRWMAEFGADPAVLSTALQAAQRQLKGGTPQILSDYSQAADLGTRVFRDRSDVQLDNAAREAEIRSRNLRANTLELGLRGDAATRNQIELNDASTRNQGALLGLRTNAALQVTDPMRAHEIAVLRELGAQGDRRAAEAMQINQMNYELAKQQQARGGLNRLLSILAGGALAFPG